MSGTNKIIVSSNAKKGSSNSALVPCLENANEEAIKIQGESKEKKAPKK